MLKNAKAALINALSDERGIMAIEIAILSHDARWKGLAPTVRRAVEAVLTKQKLKKVALAIVLSNDAEVQALNRDYRKKNKPTNVLSFPDGAVDAGIKNLGDVVISYDTVIREAEAQKKKLKHHVTHLTIHGVLHLLGFDHEAEHDAHAMESLEIALLQQMGIASPY